MKLISLAEYAEMHGVKQDTVRQKVLRGYLKAEKIGRNWVIDRDTPYIDNRMKGEKGSFSNPIRLKMERLAGEVCSNWPVYFTEKPVKNIVGDKSKYFLCLSATNDIICSWQTQKEAIDGLKDIMSNTNIDFSKLDDEKYIYDFGDALNWKIISLCETLTEDFMRKYQDKLDWCLISEYQKMSEDFIREFQDRVDWYYIFKKQTLSEEFVCEFKDKIDWQTDIDVRRTK